MHFQWESLVMAAAGFATVAAYQAFFLDRAMKHIATENQRAASSEQWSKLIRQDTAATMTGIGITNGLLGAILAVLVFR